MCITSSIVSVLTFPNHKVVLHVMYERCKEFKVVIMQYHCTKFLQSFIIKATIIYYGMLTYLAFSFCHQLLLDLFSL